MSSFRDWVAEPGPPLPRSAPLPSVGLSFHLPVDDHAHNCLRHPTSPARAFLPVHLTPRGFCLHWLQPIAAFPVRLSGLLAALSVDKQEDLMLLLWSLSLQSKPFPTGKLIITRHQDQAVLHLAVCKWLGNGAWRLVRRQPWGDCGGPLRHVEAEEESWLTVSDTRTRVCPAHSHIPQWTIF